jgi:Rps23 Pro-64 3,4-dihydroxylase Tpa1-like proline 4-hydroxylase
MDIKETSGYGLSSIVYRPKKSMADLEVENTLREIRERVRAEARAQVSAPRASEPLATQEGAATTTGVSEARARVEAHLASIERTWNRLPPVTSYRRGWAARVELWIKRQIKRATYWFTWEQVNFNASVRHSLRDMLHALDAYEQQLSLQFSRQLSHQLSQTRADFDAALLKSKAESETRFASVEARFASVEARLASVEARQAADGAELRHQLAAIVRQLRSEIETLSREQQAQAEAIRNEERERVEYLTGEQRVAFKQLSLEATEAAVAADRARRSLEQRIEEVEKKVMSDE